MVGVPSSRGCASCRKAKKKCDLGQPKCGRCTRVGHACVGNGARRFKFHQYRPDTQLIISPSSSPKNETTKLAAEFVSIMEIDDVRYSFGEYGPSFFTDLPRRMGSHPALDATVSSLTASFKAIRIRKTRDPNVLALFGKALRALQDCLGDPKQPVMLKLELVLMMLLCQLWIDNKHANKHRGVIAYLLKEAVSQGQVFHSSDVRAWCLQAVYAALSDPNVELGPWFWDVAIQDVIMTRPYHYEQNLYCFELGNVGDLSVFLRNPERYLYQLKCYYNMLSLERPIMREIYEKSISMALCRDATLGVKKTAVDHVAGHAALLLLAALIAPTLKPFGVLSNYIEESHGICDESILLAHQCQAFRPCGAAVVPELLKLCATLDDEYRQKELERLMDIYAEDVQGADYIGESKALRRRFSRLGWKNGHQPLLGEKETRESPPCVIL
ncbi:hypothetical protein FHETE_1847 [Fusarium heterosporum]|uniref:Zn(2)-C6 fungal-type domain-containing protein n=1 Tax=Fusarium heterosporum TaxID=42747 RepID=A0A8H5TS11_FUSHE|nr:hypothetical protein FHETE_1847 [Fusarium heterosporum]